MVVALRTPIADRALRVAAGLWWLAIAIGQWVFLYCIVALYGTTTLAGDFAAWNANPFLRKGYVAGDALGNVAFATHVLLAAVIVFGGTLQLVPQIRARAIAFHRWYGRVFLATAAAVAIAGLYMVWIRDAGGDAIDSAANTLNAALLLGFVAKTWRAARGGDASRHRRWALRTFVVVNGVFFMRIGVTAWLVLARGAGPLVFHIFDFACYLVPLAGVELYLRARDRGGAVARWSVAGGLLAITAYCALGAVAFFVFMTSNVLR